jgi:glycosyltransferase involved in cell wall biosynthesis
MLIAYYAPMKSPQHPTPSGDRRMAQLLMQAMDRGGHNIHLASQHRAYDGSGNAALQAEIKQEGDRQALGLLDAYADDKIAKPQMWFSYHLYHKAPDWIGPRVSEALNIPYVVAEASYAAKQAGGPWDLGLRASERAIQMASMVISLNPTDDGCVQPLLKPGARIAQLSPFVDTQPYAMAAREKTVYRAMAAGQYNIDPAPPWLLTVAMMRPGDKLKSYTLLGAALTKILDRPWNLLVVGDGPARAQVEEALAPLGDRVHWIGAQDLETLPGIYAACDLYVWPAVNEAFGMAFVEAQASGLAVVAGRSHGVAGVVNAPECGILVEPSNVDAMADAIASLVDNPDKRQHMAEKAQQNTWQHHGLNGAALALNQLLGEVS